MLIEYKNVTIYQDDVCVLENIDFQVNEGELVYLTGKVGSGKSSLLKTIYCELDIDEAGQAVVMDKDLMTIRRREIPELRKDMGIVFQDFQLLHDRTVGKNLEFVLRATGWKKGQEIEERINEVLSIVGMDDKIDRMPHELSGGEQQRIAIARSLRNNPKMIIADEPTGNLDIETAEGIVALMKDISQRGAAVVMSTHNTGIIKSFPGIVYKCEDKKLSVMSNDDNKD